MVLTRAREEAIRLRHDYLGTEHLLLGIIRENQSRAATILTTLSVELDTVRTLVEQAVRAGKSQIALGELPYTTRARLVFDQGLHEVREMGHSHYGSEHILLGLIREKKGIAAEILASVGVTLEAARERAIELLENSPDGREPAPAPRPDFDEVIVVHLTNGETHRITETRGPSAREFVEHIGRRGAWITGEDTFFVPLTAIARIHVYTPEEWARLQP